RLHRPAAESSARGPVPLAMSARRRPRCPAAGSSRQRAALVARLAGRAAPTARVAGRVAMAWPAESDGPKLVCLTPPSPWPLCFPSSRESQFLPWDTIGLNAPLYLFVHGKKVKMWAEIAGVEAAPPEKNHDRLVHFLRNFERLKIGSR